MSRYRIIRSNSMPVTQIKSLVDALRCNYSALEFETWDSKNKEWVELLTPELPEVSSFRYIHQVGLCTYAADAADDHRIKELWKLCDAIGCRAAGVLWTTVAEGAVSERHGRDWPHDVSFTAGYGPDGYYTALMISNESRFWHDVQMRSELFRKAVRLLALEHQISIEPHDGNFILTPHPPLRLRYRHVRPENRNPTELDILGFSTLQDTFERSRAARDGLGVHTLEVSFACTMSQEQYESVRGSLNALQSGWRLDILGTLSTSAEDVFDGTEFSDKNSIWIPAFRWYEDDANAKILGAIVMEDGECYLEIATDGGTLELIRERVAFLTDLQFVSVFP